MADTIEWWKGTIRGYLKDNAENKFKCINYILFWIAERSNLPDAYNAFINVIENDFPQYQSVLDCPDKYRILI